MATEISQQDIEISKDGIRFSYLRYLSDSAPGFIVLFAIIVAYFTDATLPGNMHMHDLLRVHPSVEVKIAFLAISFFFATPLGLVINAIGWFTVGWLNVWLAPRWFNCPRCPVVQPTNRRFHYEDVKVAFDLDYKSFFDKATLYQQILEIGHPNAIRRFEHVIGLSIFLNSCTVLLFVGALYFVFIKSCLWILAVTGASLCILLASVTDYYRHLRVLFVTFLLLNGDAPTEKEIIKKLLPLK